MRNMLIPQPDTGELTGVDGQTFEQCLQSLVDPADGIVWTADATSLRCSLVNQQVTALTGFTPAEWCAVPAFVIQHTHSDDRDDLLHLWHMAQQTPGQHVGEHRFIAVDGSTVWFRTSLSALPASIDAPALIHGTMINITAWNHAPYPLPPDAPHTAAVPITDAVLLRISDRDQTSSFLSQGWLHFTGRSNTSGGDWLEDVHPDDQSRVVQALRSASHDEQGWTLEYRLRRADRVYRWILEQATPRRTPNGNVAGYTCTCLDITDQKEREQALVASEARFRVLAENATDMLSLHAPDGTYVYASPACETLLGYTADELVGRQAYEFFHPDDVSVVEVAHYALLHDSLTYAVEYRIRCKNGQFRWFETTSRAVRDHTGAVIEIYAATRSIHDRKQAEQALREREEQLRYAVCDAPLPIMLHAEDGEVLYLSTVWTELTGYTYEDIPTFAHWTTLAYGAGHETVLQDIDQLYRLNKRVYLGEQQIRTREGSTRVWECSSAPVGTAQDGRRLVMSMAMDVTERKQAEAERAQLVAREQGSRAEAALLRKMDQLKAEFLASISHELRTPLHHIKGYTSTLLRPQTTFDTATTHEYLRIVVEECDKLEHLISDLLDTSRLDTGKLRLNIESVHLDDLVRTSVQRWQGVEGRRFDLIVPPNVPPVPADLYRIQQVVDNLLANVVQHTPRGTGAIISVNVTRQDVTISVADQGPGVSTEHMPYLFERFYQAPNDAKRHGGTGLGLFICKGIIEEHGGRIWVEMLAKPGVNICFSVPRRYHRAKTIIANGA